MSPINEYSVEKVCVTWAYFDLLKKLASVECMWNTWMISVEAKRDLTTKLAGYQTLLLKVPGPRNQNKEPF